MEPCCLSWLRDTCSSCCIFLGHYPKEIRQVVPPRSENERRSRSFWELFAYAFGVPFIFNPVDLLILDWLIVCWVKPLWVILPCTEHIAIRIPTFTTSRNS